MPKSKGPYESLLIRVPPELKEALRREAGRAGMNALAVQILAQYLGSVKIDQWCPYSGQLPTRDNLDHNLCCLGCGKPIRKVAGRIMDHLK